MSTQQLGVDAQGQLRPEETLPHPQVMQEAWQACVDVPGYEARCREELAGACSDEAATTARRLCPRTCGTCLSQGTTKGRLLQSEEQLRQQLEAAAGSDEAGPSVSVEFLGAQQTPVVVVDNFMPLSVLAKTVLVARESWLWQPPHPDLHRLWEPPHGRGAPRDERGLFAMPGRLKDTFPGMISPFHDEYQRLLWAQVRGLDLERRFAAVLSEFDDALRLEFEEHFYGLVCFSPKRLHPGQRAPHTDMSGEPKLAMVHYLTDWRAAPGELPSGGTSFYSERVTGTSHFGPRRCAELEPTHGGSHFCKHSLAYNCSRNRAPPDVCRNVPNSMAEAAARAYRAGRPSYISEGDDYFDLLHAVPPAFNRAVFYGARQLHNAYLDAAAVHKLSCSPADGRLTANVFIV